MSWNNALEELGITPNSVANELGLDPIVVEEILACDDPARKQQILYRLVQLRTDRELRPELQSFYAEFFESTSAADRFVDCVLALEDPVPRRMVNTIMRMTSLADDVERIRPGNDCIKMLFLVTAIESLYVLTQRQGTKAEMVRDFFKCRVSDEEQVLLRRGIRRSLADERDSCGGLHLSDVTIDMEEVADIVLSIRNTFAHEGIWWSFAFGSNLMNWLTVRGQERVYDVNMTFGEMRRICVLGMIRFVESHVTSGGANSVLVLPQPPTV